MASVAERREAFEGRLYTTCLPICYGSASPQ